MQKDLFFGPKFKSFGQDKKNKQIKECSLENIEKKQYHRDPAHQIPFPTQTLMGIKDQRLKPVKHRSFNPELRNNPQ